MSSIGPLAWSRFRRLKTTFVVQKSCPFCFPSTERIFHVGDLVLGLWDGFPVSPGHALLVTRRHISSWFEATAAEQQELLAAAEIAKRAIEAEHAPDGFNIGINVGAAAGQTIPHLHMHVIPRTEGDVADPRGGVRYVIPSKANYLQEPAGETSESQESLQTPRPQSYGHLDSSKIYPEQLPAEQDPASASGLVTGDKEDPLLPHLLHSFDQALSVDLAVAFIQRSGVERIRAHLLDLLEPRPDEPQRPARRVRILTGDYMDVTDPAALRSLLDLREELGLEDVETNPNGSSLELHVFEAENQAFHPKMYLFRYGQGAGVAYIGSSNLSKSALETGVEWNYRIVTAQDGPGFTATEHAFEKLLQHPQTRLLDADWVDSYAARRQTATPSPIIDTPLEPDVEVPQPHLIQEEALAALATTRDAGNRAGLVVLATGLGKTWLAAFDSASQPDFKRVLFVAHREEILAQAMETFRKIRPTARLGRFTGKEKTADADIVFASVQTLGRQKQIRNFDPASFDYIVMDEFHHAAAATYRRILDHFEPKFLLGLTATPERTDGGDLLGLCGENRVYSCDVKRGIELGLLSPFHYFGVPDEVDYANVPWRSTRFDPEALENAVITESRAQNALEQWQKHAGPGTRTIAFCCSKRHADYMSNAFRQAGVRVASVHSGPESDPRATSLEKLREGKLDVVFAVDMFNEGVDIPSIDAVLMLRPTESRILWLQQFGRGLRRAEGKSRLTVVDYIGNHKVFLNKPMALLDLGNGHREIGDALTRVVSGDFELPPGCEITYDLASIDILRGLLRLPKDHETEALENWYREFRARTGARPTALQAFHEGYNPRAARKKYGSWIGLLQKDGDLGDSKVLFGEQAAKFLEQLETTQMSKSFKMLLLQAMLNLDQLPGSLTIDALTSAFAKLARRQAKLADEVLCGLDDTDALTKYLEINPIEAWAGGKGTGKQAYFTYDGAEFRSSFAVPQEHRATFQSLARELVDWRLGEYLARDPEPIAGEWRCRISHSNGSPFIRLPTREAVPGMPNGPTEIVADGHRYEAIFAKIAVNVLKEPGQAKNVLGTVLRRWFGPDVGLPGTRFEVVFHRAESGEIQLAPVKTVQRDELEL